MTTVPNHGTVRQLVRIPWSAGMSAILFVPVRGYRRTTAVIRVNRDDARWRIVRQDHIVPHSDPAHMLRDGFAVHGQRLHKVLHRALEHVEFNVST